MPSAKEILDERAHLLARLPSLDSRQDTRGRRPYVTFKQGTECFAVEAVFVREVIAFPDYTRLPESPPEVKGVFHFRGIILPLLSLTGMLGLRQSGGGAPSWGIVLGNTRAEFCVGVESLDDLIFLRAEEIKPSLALTEKQGRLARGVTERGVVVLDGRLLIDSPLTPAEQGNEMRGMENDDS